ncbi:MAG: lactate racemase domain-containing protein [Pirellula sp.]
MNVLPKMIRVRQQYPTTEPVDIQRTIASEFSKLRPMVRKGSSIAVGVGSRGISNLQEIVSAVIEQLKSIGANPFIIPAMGSHGGATPEGQREVLESYGVTESSMGVPIRASLDVRQIGTTADSIPVYCSTDALAADGILLINRIKPHTDFFGTLGSGLIKMSVIGLGKRTGANTMHLASTQFGYEHAIRSMASVILRTAPVLGGVAIIENQFHETARLVALHRDEMEAAEADLLAQARALMPFLPFDEIDLLIIDAIGKNISGAGLDPNVINREVHGYSTLAVRSGRTSPFIRRIFVRGLTPESHGNAIGIGMADATTTRLVRSADLQKTNINAMTALTPHASKIPITFDTDIEAIDQMLGTLPIPDRQLSRIVRIADTLSVAEMEISEPLWNEYRSRANITSLIDAKDIQFDTSGNLV